MEVVQFSNKDRKLLKQFVKFHWTLYKDDPNYVPKLNMELLGNRLLGEVGLLTDKHPFHKHADVAYFIAYRDNKVIGRVAGCVDRLYNEQSGTQSVIFGFFEVINDFEVAKALLDRVKAWGREKGMTQLLGPMSFSTNHTIGVQLDAFGTLPYFETAYNPPYYPELLERYGLEKGMDVVAQLLPMDAAVYGEGLQRFKREAAEAIAAELYTFRPVNIKNPEEDKKHLLEVYNAAWRNNWGAVGLTEEEFNLVVEEFKIACDPETTLLAFVGKEPVGLFIIMPDVYDCIRKKYGFLDRLDLFRVARMLWNKKRTKRARILMLGIKEKYRQNGLRPILVSEGLERAIAKNQYDVLEAGWLLETNSKILRTCESFAAKRYKTWRIYQKAL